MEQSKPTLVRDPVRRHATPGSWRPGVSGNPRGRPRSGNALAEAIRRGCDPDELVQIALDLARHAKVEAVRIQALTWLQVSGYNRPADRVEVSVGQPEDQDDERLAEQLTDEEHDQLDALEAARATLLARAIKALPAGTE